MWGRGLWERGSESRHRLPELLRVGASTKGGARPGANVNQHTPELPCFLLSWQWPLHWPLFLSVLFLWRQSHAQSQLSPSHSSAESLQPRCVLQSISSLSHGTWVQRLLGKWETHFTKFITLVSGLLPQAMAPSTVPRAS